MKHKPFSNRRGVTLLFVISMILLFLLMGTAFVVVSNDFVRSSKISSQQTIKTINNRGEFQGQKLLSRAFYDLLRGPSLDNANSPIRTHSILGDMYGYGLTAYIKNIDNLIKEYPDAAEAGTPHFFRLQLVGSFQNINDNNVTFDDFLGAPGGTNDGRIIANNILDGKPIYTALETALAPDPGDNELPFYDIMPSTPGNLTGQLLSIVSGSASGLTTRIIDHQVFPVEDPAFMNGVRYEHRFVVVAENNLPEVNLSNLYLPADPLNSLVLTHDDILAAALNAIPTRVVINGRAFAGTGTGTYDPTTALNMTALTMVDENQRGNNRDTLTTGFLARTATAPDGTALTRSNNYAINESYDDVDGNNMYLSGTAITYPNNDPTMPAMYQRPTITVIPSFSPMGRPNTAGGNFAPPNTSSDFMQPADIDMDGDGQMGDAVFLDLGYPAFAYTDGTKVKPLVAFHVVDLDSLPNINVHGNRSQIADYSRFSTGTYDIVHENASADAFTAYGPTGSFVFPQGQGFGPADIRLDTVFSETWVPLPADGDGMPRIEADRLMIGDVTTATASVPLTVRLPGRYGNDADPAATPLALLNGGGPVPGNVDRDGTDWFNNERFGAYGFFGFPTSPSTGADPGGLFGGNFQSSPLDIYGRFQVGFPELIGGNEPGDPNAIFTTGMPIADVVPSLGYAEIINNPYEVNHFANRNAFTNTDALFTLEELNRIYRQNDPDVLASAFGLEPLATDLLGLGLTLEQQRAIRLTLLAPSLNNQVATLDDMSATPERFANNRNYLSFTTDSYEVPTTFQEYVAGGNVPLSDGNPSMTNTGDLGSGLQTLVGKLHHILSAENNPNFGMPFANAMPDATDRVNREIDIMANIAGYLPDAGDADFVLDGTWRAMLSADLRAGRPFDINRPFGDGRDDDGDGLVDGASEIPDVIPHPEVGAGVVFDYDFDSIQNDNGAAGQIYFNRQLYARQLYILTLLATEFVDRNGDGIIFNDFTFDANGDMDAVDDIADRLAYRQIIAQWAINVVDFRDPDSIMTPFEFDLNPFNGWDVDGDLIPPFEVTPDRAVVWGTERPELLITETLALHNRRVQDTDDDPSNDMHPDDPLADSRMVPIASAFFELYNPWIQTGDVTLNTESDPIPAIEFDNTIDMTNEITRRTGGVNLTQLAGGADPVWRLVVIPGLLDSNDAAMGFHQFDPLLDPDNFDPLAAPPILLREDARIIYFQDPANASLTAEGVTNLDSVYVNTNNGAAQVVYPGEYAVAGSSGIMFGGNNTTFLGRRSTYDDSNETVVPDAADLELSDTRRIELDPGNDEVRVYDSAGMLSTAANVRVLPIEGLNSGRSLGLSDPYLGYDGLNDGAGGALTVVMGDDGPYFVDAGGMRATAQNDADRQAGGMPGHVGLPAEFEGVHSSQYIVLLQRLADPTRAFDSDTNPYRTIDSSSTDLAVFNGMPDTPEMAMGGFTPDPLYFGSFERRSNLSDDDFSQVNAAADPNSGRYRMLWKSDINGAVPAGLSPPAVDPATHHFDFDLVNSLGKLNASYGSTDTTQTMDTAVTTNAADSTPFAWLTWNNRPFASAYELTLVPYTSSYYLTNRFDISMVSADERAGPYALHAATPAGMGAISAAIKGTTVSGDFPHLLNFHADDFMAAPLLHRIFDYVEVPSHYAGTKRYFDPGVFYGTAGETTEITQSFAPPFDYISNFRYPGKININTIQDHRAWNALMGDYATKVPDSDLPMPDGILDENFLEFQGITGMADTPFRAHTATNMISGGTVQGADAGLFRRIMGADIAFFDYNFADPDMEDPLNMVGRNAYFKYHKRNRLGNLVTNRSSVFAVRVEIRYFEVTNVNDNLVDNAGTELIGAEYTPAGKNRAFFIVDRSIPVAFEPGKNHNVERAVRVSNYIE